MLGVIVTILGRPLPSHVGLCGREHTTHVINSFSDGPDRFTGVMGDGVLDLLDKTRPSLRRLSAKNISFSWLQITHTRCAIEPCHSLGQFGSRHVSIYPTPPRLGRCDTKSTIFKRVTAGVNSEFSFSKIGSRPICPTCWEKRWH